jgi:hypothetical protein
MITYTGNPRTLFVERREKFTSGAMHSAVPLDPRLSSVNHSPTGFGWGYWGSGPAQLAFALIADALETKARSSAALEGADRLEATFSARRRAANPSLYQEFKQRVVWTWPTSAPFTITDAEILAHVERIERDLQIEPLTAAERQLAEWLSTEDFSQYGECHGATLDALIAKGFAQVSADSSNQAGFIAKGDAKAYHAVSLTDAGRAALKALPGTDAGSA